MKFGFIGMGKISNYHTNAVLKLGHTIQRVHDPAHELSKILDYNFFEDLDYVVICSPSHLHTEHIKLCLHYDKKIIVEKPMCLPWEPIIDDHRINIVLQLRWMDIPEKADLIEVKFVRDENYFKSWKGDPRKTGGLFYNLFIHYIQLAIDLNAEFLGSVVSDGKQYRKIDNIDILEQDMNELYIRMYRDIIENDNGVKPKDLYYLHWVMDHCGVRFGIGKDALNKQFRFNPSTTEFNY